MARIEKMSFDDLGGVHALEKECFPNPLVYNKESLRYDLAFTAKEEDRLIGYIVGEKILDECHILRIAVSPEFRRKGVAGELLDKFAGDCLSCGLKKICLEVRASGVAALNLYKRSGFRQIYIRKKYYPDNNDDAIFMEKVLEG